jgi:hypothetical protein
MHTRAFEILGVGRDVDWETIRAAYRALARRYHPDGSAPDPARMAEINRAYEWVERHRGRTADGMRSPAPVAPAAPSVPAGGLYARMRRLEGVDAPDPEVTGPTDGSLLRRIEDSRANETPVIDFGEYAGWRVADVARVDPRYLRWLSRHSSGVRFRDAIAQVLGEPDEGRRAAILR